MNRCLHQRCSAAVTLATFAIALAGGLAAPSPIRAQPLPAGDFCTYAEKVPIAGHIVDQFIVMACADGSRNAALRVVPGGDHIALPAALALRSTLAFADPPKVWCLGQRHNTEMNIQEATVTREDWIADFGQQNNLSNIGVNVWTWSCNMTFPAASVAATAIRNAPNNQARTWCVLWGNFFMPVNLNFIDAFRILERNITAGVSAGYPSSRCGLTSVEADTLVASLEGSGSAATPTSTTTPPLGPTGPVVVTPLAPGTPLDPRRVAVWCVIERGMPFGDQVIPQAAAIACENFGRAGPGWILTAGPTSVRGAKREAAEINRRAVARAAGASCSGAMPGSVPAERAADGSYQCVCAPPTKPVAGACAPTTFLVPPQVQQVTPLAPLTIPSKPAEKQVATKPSEPTRPEPKKPAAGALAMSGPVWVQQSRKSGNPNSSFSVDYTQNSVHLLTVDGTSFRADIQWTFSAPPATLTPGQEFTITITGSRNQISNSQPAAFGTPPTATAYHKGLTEVKKQHAWGDGVSKSQNGEYVFRVPENATGATIYFQADAGSGTFAIYRYGDHKP